MKIYINNLNIEILPTIMKLFNDYYINSKTYIQIYSIDGIYEIDESSVTKLNCFDNDIQIFKNYYDNFTLILDPSYFITEKVNNINPEHISTRMKRCVFGLNKDSKIKLIIEGELFEKTANNCDINPKDIYFEMPNNTDINDALVKKEIIVFLSLLN
jgi:hypothetical protein